MTIERRNPDRLQQEREWRRALFDAMETAQQRIIDISAQHFLTTDEFEGMKMQPNATQYSETMERWGEHD